MLVRLLFDLLAAPIHLFRLVGDPQYLANQYWASHFLSIITNSGEPTMHPARSSLCVQHRPRRCFGPVIFGRKILELVRVSSRFDVVALKPDAAPKISSSL
jgi:hypothetical protein